jgi:non-lysosomal glucosylceramidase
MQSRKRSLVCLILIAFLFAIPFAGANDDIPKAAWKRPLGETLENPGKKKPELEAEHVDDGYWQGAPVGGFGAGTFSRSYRGDFVRWHIKGGVHKYQTVAGNQFAMFQKSEGDATGVARVLMNGKPRGSALSAWQWDYPVGAGDYYALYPKSWFDYRWEKFPAHVMLEQFSPILPNNYKETSYPVAVYRWHAENPTNKPVTVAVMLTWENMIGWFRTYRRDLSDDLNEGNFDHRRSEPLGPNQTMQGVVLDRNHVGKISEDWDGQFVIASVSEPGVELTYQTTFNPDGTGEEIWKPFAQDGKLSDSDECWTSSGERIGAAIALRFTLQPGEKKIVPMVIAWDLPVVEFGSGRKWYRRYTDYYGTSGLNAWAIAKDALKNATAWSAAIDAWQAPFANDSSKPLWYRGMLFNELYPLADGGTFWGRPIEASAKETPTYSFMECFDYPFYETLDVRFYGSMPLIKFWPDIEKGVMREIADTVPQESNERMAWVWKTQETGTPQYRIRKAKGAVPHDLGVPTEDPFKQINQFSWQDTNRWKDLNPKFVLLVYRDFILSGANDTAFLKYTWPAVRESIGYLDQFDNDGDGIPENQGYPDQTYDEWVVRGESAYSGGLWLGSLRAAEEMAKKLGDSTAANHYREVFLKAQASYIKKLWNGEYFRYDTLSEYKDNIQADQLAGQWYANLTGLGDLVPLQMQRSSLQRIFDYNVMKFADGNMGAVNGISADGKLITLKDNQQVREVWTGTTMALAGLMLSDGMTDQAYRTLWGLYHTSYETKGYWFRTPEAWDITGNYRASMYMRPAAIWTMEMMPKEQAKK